MEEPAGPVPAQPEAAPAPRGIAAWVARVENAASSCALLLLAILPVLELVLRAFFDTGIPGSISYVQNLTLWVGFLGALVAARQKRHLNLATTVQLLPVRWRPAVSRLTSILTVAVSVGLAWASFLMVRAETESPVRIGGWLPIWVVQSILPLSFALVAVRFVLQAGGRRERAIAALGIPLAWAIGFPLEGLAPHILWPGIALLVVSAALGAPIYAAMGGSALLLFFADGITVASIPVEAYRLVVSPSIPTIPLFTFAGFILAEGGASRRLVRLFRALFGWMPGGIAVVAVLVCAFFTTFTGASGVTILALGGLLLPVLIQSGYRENFSVGLLTSSGSLGLLFPPCLPVILYGVVAHVAIPDLYKAAAIPGALLVLTICGFGVWQGVRNKTPRPKFEAREAGAALWESKWELILPVVALVSIFGGFCTLVEAAAITVVYALVAETALYRDLGVKRDLPRVLLKCSELTGGVFIILAAAMGLTNYMVDAEVPMHATEWVRAHIESKLVFLLALNVSLLIVGCLMDIYSAIVVVVPLVLPISQVFGIDPLHLGVIFLANLELGYLTPPVGMNLFLASYRFEKPMARVCRDTLPFLIALLVVVLLITYVPLFFVDAP